VRRWPVLSLLATIFAFAAPAAQALDPPQIDVAGANSKWISGDLLQQTGLNCSTAIIGSAYTEVMVSGIAGYGGAPNGGVPRVNDPYWTSFLVSIPGNPCGTGSSSVVTTLVLPPDTQIDASRQIKCYGLPRNASVWENLTNASWSFLGQSGPYCANQATPSPYHPGGNQIGFRPLANGQLFWIFVPVKSSAPLVGAGTSPPDAFRWLTDATGVYSNPGLSTVWANVFASGTGGNPFVYFARDPTIIPFWKDDAPNDPNNGNITTKSRAEWFANLFSGGKTGTFCWELHYGASPAGNATPAISSCPPNSYPGWNGTIDTSGDLWQVFGSGDAEGPNGGYSPFYYDDDPPNTTFTVRWKFIYSDNGTQTVSKDAQFTTLAGPDQDGDGVANNGTDACPNVKGTLPNGCLPAVQDDPDKDGVYGGADLCPNQDGQGALNGCPGGIVPPPPPNPSPNPSPSPKVLVGILQVKKGALFKRSALAKGAPVKFTCTVDSTAKGALSISKKTAKTLGISTKKKTVGIAAGKGQCKEAGGGSLRLKLVRAYAKKVKRARKKFPATLSVKLTAPGQTPVTMKRTVKVG
jgi:hypothetical protein